MNADRLLVEAINLMRAAISSGDWKVDGACDPDMLIWAVENYLRGIGFSVNAIDGHIQEFA